MTNLELLICEAENNGEISIDTRDELLNIITEGSNMDLLNLYNNEINELKKDLKEAKKLMNKVKDYNQAIKKFESVKNRSEKIKKYVKECDDTTIEKLLGSFTLIWKGILLTLLSIGTATVGFITSPLMKISKIKAPIKPNTFHNQDYNWAKGEWELNSIGLKKIEKYNKELLSYEETCKSILQKNKPLTALSGVLTGVGIAASIYNMIKKLIDFNKASEGMKKLLEKDMDKEHWDRMKTKIYNPMRGYIYQILDEMSILSSRCIEKIKSREAFMKESCEVDIKIAIYESEVNGNITAEERDILIDKLNEIFLESSVYPTIKIGKYEVVFAYADMVTPKLKNEAENIIKSFNFNKFEKDLNKFIKKEYNDYIDNVMDEDVSPISLSNVISSKYRTLFSFSCKNDTISPQFDIWVSYKHWADSLNSVLCPEVECYIKNNNYDMTMHLG